MQSLSDKRMRYLMSLEAARQLVIDMREEGLNDTQISRMTGLGVSTIKRRRRDYYRQESEYDE